MNVRKHLYCFVQELANSLNPDHETWLKRQSVLGITHVKAQQAVEIWSQQKQGVWNDTQFSNAMEDLERAVKTLNQI